MLRWLLSNTEMVIQRIEKQSDQVELFAAIRSSVYDSALPNRFRSLILMILVIQFHCFPKMNVR
eukprot:UN15052